MLDVGKYLLWFLAIAGGAALGGLISGWVFRLAVKPVVKRPAPLPMVRLIQGLGALAGGLLVWAWLSGPGSGFGSGFGLGSGSGQGPGTTAASPSTPKTTSESESPPTKSDKENKASPPGANSLRIVLLGGDRVKDQRFYVLEGRNQPLTLSELQHAIRTRLQDKEQPPLKSLELLIYASSVAKDHPAVLNLVKWAKDNGLALALSFPPSDGQ
jgi:hypothetical protein